MAVRDTRGTAAAWSKEILSGIEATRLLLMVANSAYVPAMQPFEAEGAKADLLPMWLRSAAHPIVR